MFQAYFESLKYVGHLLPISFLRIVIGYFYIQQAFQDWKLHILSQSTVSDVLIEALNKSQMPYWYRLFLSDHLIPHWTVYVFILIGIQTAIGLSYVLGYVVRPMSALAILFCLNYLIIANSSQELFFRLLMACHILMAWVAAGRCLGFDYYFFRRYRGIWW